MWQVAAHDFGKCGDDEKAEGLRDFHERIVQAGALLRAPRSPLVKGLPSYVNLLGSLGSARDCRLHCHHPTSCHAPCLNPTWRYTPSASNPTDSCNATLAAFGN